VRAAYVTLGWLCVGLGALGAVVPLLPTTVFLLIALWAFARGSHRFHAWLYSHPRFGPPLQAWERHGVISRTAKVCALLTMAASVAVLTIVSQGPLLPLGVGALLACIAVYILTRPSRAPAEGGS